MCGICGFTGLDDGQLLQAMTAALQHRGPDSEGFYCDAGINLGVRRLRIIDLVSGDQPIYDEESLIWVVLNGEIYNFRQLRQSLINKGHKFYTKTDTEVIVHLYQEYGKDCVKHLDGMFCFALWDKTKKELFIARDRLGIKPLYYHFDKGVLSFASELKSLIKNASIDLEISHESAAYFFNYLCTPGDASIFKNIHKLPPACTLSFKDGILSIEEYWTLKFKDKIYASDEELKERALYLLEEAVKKRLISDVPLGVFLSGGIDSSAIVAMMRKVSQGAIHSFSIGYGKKDKSFNELDYARIVSKAFDTKHKEFIVEPNILEILPKVVSSLDEPFGDSSAILNYLIAQEASKEITVALAGVGGDEMFGGYPRYLGARFSLAYEKIPYFLRKVLGSSSGLIRENLSSQNFPGWVKRFLQGGRMPADERYISWMRFFSQDAQDSLFSADFKKEIEGFSPTKRHKHYFNNSDAFDYLDKIMYLDVKTYLCDDLLYLVDRMSMAHSLEVRVPFCDHRLVEFAASLPFEDKYKGFKLKGLLRKALADVLPYEILHRHKKGFSAPLGRWIKEDLRSYVSDVLSEAEIKKTGFLRYEYVQKILDEHFNGKANNTYKIWPILVFKLWLDNYKKNF